MNRYKDIKNETSGLLNQDITMHLMEITCVERIDFFIFGEMVL